jgi:phage/plasmid primase-like uncharacterized protein
MMEVLFTPSLPEAFAQAGLLFPGDPEPGKVVRFPTSKDRSDRAGWLKLLPDGTGAAFGDWRQGSSYCWQRRTDTGPISPQERDQARQRTEEARRHAEREREESYASAARECASLWNGGKPAPIDHTYLHRKGITPHMARLDSAGRIMLPVLDESGTLQSLQYIAEDGAKRFHLGGKMQGGRMYLGTPVDGSPLALAEGFATGASIHESSGLSVVVGFSGSNLRHVAESLRRAYPRSEILIAADRDAHGKGAEYGQAACEAAGPARMVLPAFKDRREAGDFNDLAQVEGPETVREQIGGGLRPPSRFQLLSAADLASLPPIHWRVRGVLPAEGIAALFGPSGSGKSFLALHILAAISSGADWFGCRVSSAPVLYVGLEGEAGIAQRVRAHQAHHGPLTNQFRFALQPFDLRNPTDCADLLQAALAAGVGGGVICIDTLNRAAPGIDENDSRNMGEVIAAAKALQAKLGGLMLLIHHSGKDQSKGLRGHSSLHAALDAAIEVTRLDDLREWKTHKSKDGADSITHPFRLAVVEVGADEDDGEPITSCAVSPIEDLRTSVRRAIPPKSGNQRIIWDSLGELFRAAGDIAPAGAPAELPNGRPCLRLEDAISKTRCRLACDQKRQTERTQSAITGLINRGLIECREGWIWLA